MKTNLLIVGISIVFLFLIVIFFNRPTSFSDSGLLGYNCAKIVNLEVSNNRLLNNQTNISCSYTQKVAGGKYYYYEVSQDFTERIGTIKPDYFTTNIQANCDAAIDQYQELLVSGSQVYGCMSEYGQ